MPQREFWTERYATEVSFRYRCDAADPDGDGKLSVTVYDQGGSMMEHASIAVPVGETLEMVQTALTETWQAYLFGDRHAAPRALQHVCQRFRKARAIRRLRAL